MQEAKEELLESSLRRDTQRRAALRQKRIEDYRKNLRKYSFRLYDLVYLKSKLRIQIDSWRVILVHIYAARL